MRTDYKFWFIRRDDNGFITEVAVRFYEGEYQTIDSKQVYVRTKRLETLTDLSHLAKDGTLKQLKEVNGREAVLYYPEDFGKIKTDDELRSFLNKEIAKDTGRGVINEQKI